MQTETTTNEIRWVRPALDVLDAEHGSIWARPASGKAARFAPACFAAALETPLVDSCQLGWLTVEVERVRQPPPTLPGLGVDHADHAPAAISTAAMRVLRVRSAAIIGSGVKRSSLAFWARRRK